MMNAIVGVWVNFNMKVIPAILPILYRAIEASIEKVIDIVDTVQIDIVDGQFANNRTWIYNTKDSDQLESIIREEAGMPQWERVNYELDLLVNHPMRQMDTFIALGPSKIIFHIESNGMDDVLSYLASLPLIISETISFGIAINVETDPSLIAAFIPYIDTVQCMGIARPGFQAQAFDERVLTQIARVKALYPEKTISVDGGVSLLTAPLLRDAGASVLVVGSAIFQSTDIHGTIETLQQI